jgi:hypothetical protein
MRPLSGVAATINAKSSQELRPKYTEQEHQLTCPEGARVRAAFQQPELRGMSARARPRVALRMVLVLFFLQKKKKKIPALGPSGARALGSSLAW